jgi:hypothetical protein
MRCPRVARAGAVSSRSGVAARGSMERPTWRGRTDRLGRGARARKGSDGWRLPRSRAGCEAAFVGVGGRRALARAPGFFLEAADLLVGRGRVTAAWRGWGSWRGRAGVRPSGSSAASRRVVVWLGRGVLRSGRPPGRPGAWRVAVAWRGFGFVSWSRGRPAERELGRFEEGAGGGVVGPACSSKRPTSWLRVGGGGVAGVRVVVAWASGRAGARPLRGGCWWGCRGVRGGTGVVWTWRGACPRWRPAPAPAPGIPNRTTLEDER